MTIRTTYFGGTNWSDGQVLYAADLNDTFGAVDTAIDTKEYTHITASNTGTGYTDVTGVAWSNTLVSADIVGLSAGCTYDLYATVSATVEHDNAHISAWKVIFGTVTADAVVAVYNSSSIGQMPLSITSKSTGVTGVTSQNVKVVGRLDSAGAYHHYIGGGKTWLSGTLAWQMIVTARRTS